ncbi:hypothetical protein LCGC14_1740110 [marine sediment metagenome]|uniref:Uncharacterized protein n=1 Tax=marine sediment metagenome TaxID=412755 RepID=A0A0F9JM80_9ZZZZ
MMGFRAKTKKAARELIGTNVEHLFQDTSLFGLEYKPTGKFTVCISLDCTRIRNVFGTLTVEDNILVNVK